MSHESARDVWRKKLEFLLKEEGKVSDSGQKFKLQEEIAEAKARLKELGERTRDSDDKMLRVTTTRLHHGAEKLVGREKELGNLDKAWEDPKTHVVTIVAWGGVGKTALVVDWMARMARDGWCGAERVFDWSFYSQGTSETTSASSDAFVAKALDFFGDSEMAKSAASPWDKGERLARLVAEHKTLLVLDGVEPLQYPPGPVGGKLKDPALEALLKGLAQHNAGLCIVTTRETLTDLASWQDTTSAKWELEHLSEEAGAQLLFDAGVMRAGNAEIKAMDTELKDAAREVGGHALTLRLLGNYLKLAHEGDVRKRDVVKLEEADPQFKTNPKDADKSYGHAFKVMGVYERWLSASGEDGKREVALLQLLGLFDRPADGGCLAALRKEPVIDGLTEPLVGLTEAQWNTTISRLQNCGIITTHTEESKIVNRQSAIDAHPLVREYFGKQLREQNPIAWRAAHRRLYEHLCKHKEGDAPTLEDLQPLYQAVAHGCLAGLQKEAWYGIYWRRINRSWQEFYAPNRLGAVGADLGALSCFFERPWSEPSPNLDKREIPTLQSNVASCLWALGRLAEALEPMQAGLRNYLRQKDWRFAAIAANNLCELELTLGEVVGSVGDAEQSVTYADRSGDAFMRLYSRTTLADALHQAGWRPVAQARFRQAEQIHAEDHLDYLLRYSLRVFRVCELLLADAERTAWQFVLKPEAGIEKPESIKECRAVSQRAAQALAIAEQKDWLLDIAAGHLTLGRAALYEAILAKSEIRNAKSEIEEAVSGLRHASRSDYLPRGLFTRSWLHFLEGKFTGPESAQADLDEAREIAERGHMKLFMADIYLYRARLFGPRNKTEKYPWESPKADLASAQKLIDQCGYHRRDAELADAQEAAKNW